MKFRYDVLFAIVWFACAFPLHAQKGCVDSPEDSTVVLALVASAGALFYGVRGWLRSRHNSSGR
jgi:XrtJ-associated TM-motif-TM protein